MERARARLTDEKKQSTKTVGTSVQTFVDLSVFEVMFIMLWTANHCKDVCTHTQTHTHVI